MQQVVLTCSSVHVAGGFNLHVVHMTTHIVDIHMYKWVMVTWWTIRGFGLLEGLDY